MTNLRGGGGGGSSAVAHQGHPGVDPGYRLQQPPGEPIEPPQKARLRGAIEQNAHAARLATANGIIEATDVIDVDIQSLGARARVLVLPNTPAVLSVGRPIEDHWCTFNWTPGEASITDPDGGVHMCEVRNYVPHLDAGRDHDHHQRSEDTCYLCHALPAVATDDGIIQHEAPDVEADMEGDLECGEYIDHELHHLPKRADCHACSQAKMKMIPARRRDPALEERPAAWGHTMLGDHISAADLDLERIDLKLGTTALDAGTLFGDLIVVSSKNVNDTIMAFREFYGEDPFCNLHSDIAKELKAAAEQELMVHLTPTPHRPESNGVVERFSQLIVGGARCLLFQSGLPGRYWHYACRAFLLARNACAKGKDGRTAWDRRFGKEFHSKLIPFGSKVIRRRPKHDAAKFAPRGSEGIMLGRHLEPGGLLKGDYLVLNIDNLSIEGNPKSTIHRMKEVVRAPGPNTYPLNEARIAKRKKATEDTVEDGILEELEVEEDVEMPTMEEIEDMERPLAIEDEVIVEGGILQRIPRASRIYMPRVGPPPRPPVPNKPLDDSTAIKFNHENPKRPSSRSHEVHELYKMAKTVGEARRLGASTGHIKYDLSKGHAKLGGTTAVVCFGPSYTLTDFEKQDPEAALAAPLLRRSMV